MILHDGLASGNKKSIFVCPIAWQSFLHPALDQRFHSGLSTGNGPAWSTWRRAFHDVSSFSVLTVAGQFLLFNRITFSNSCRSRRTRHVHPTAFAVLAV